ncbi:MAG: hypothetical protein IPG69_07160 [Flavobacteriales bacterium]|nr:hypothetical protein [Flavobacteriales bacterium]
MIFTEYYGYVTIHFWEYLMMFVLFVLMYIYFARQKNLRIKTEPEYKYFLWGLLAKVSGGLFFSLIYFYYYQGGDTISYFYSAVALGNLFKQSPSEYFTVVFGEATLANKLKFTLETGEPYFYVYNDPRAYMVTRLVSPLTVLTMNSYLLTTTLVSSASYIAVWRCYQTFIGYFPRLRRELAIAVLFMPSSIFWGSAILKDTFTFAGVCWFFHGVDDLFFHRERVVRSTWHVILGLFLMIAIKPYVFMAIFPVCLLWLSYGRLQRIRNSLIKYLVVPMGFVFMVFISFVILTQLGESLDKFSLDKALDTILTAQQDLKRSEEYGSNYFDVGELDGTWTNVLSKFPVATWAALFRPDLTECKNFVMYLAGLENTFLLFMFLLILWRSRIALFPALVIKNPLVLMCVVFVLTYGFITGITTPNFGALVRFKIPLIPFFVASMYIMLYLLKVRRATIGRGKRFRFEDYMYGDPDRPRALRKAAVEAKRKAYMAA